jgi:predicted 2-oxoglutarate/Fe(II)-dependent dioxygenase YbiX
MLPKDSLEQYILVLNDVLPKQVCINLLEEYADTDEWRPSQLEQDIVDAAVRKCSVLSVSHPQNIERRNTENRKRLDQQLFNIAGTALQQYRNKHDECHVSKDTGYDMLKYEIGDFYIQHTDSFGQGFRTLSCSFALNDDYEGGQFSFFDGQLDYQLKQGSAILFPSNFMFPHQIKPVVNGTRYSIVTWFI